MLRVYLDQNKWIDLARAAHGRPGGESHRDALDLLRYATEQYLVSLPLSMAHYFETWKRGTPPHASGSARQCASCLGCTPWPVQQR